MMMINNFSHLPSIFADLRKSAADEDPHVSFTKFFALQTLLKEPSITIQEDKVTQNSNKQSACLESEKCYRKTQPPNNGSALNPPSLLEEPCGSKKLEWARADGIKEICEVRANLQKESNSWFLRLLEGALNSGFYTNAGAKKSTKDRASKHSKETDERIAVTLSKLKQASDWLDQMKSEEGEDKVGSSETIDRLKQKIYACLLGYMDSAASALERQSNCQ